MKQPHNAQVPLQMEKKKKEKCNTAFQVHTTNTDGHRLRKRKQSAQLHGPYQMTSCNCHNLCKISWDISAYHMKQMILLHSGSPHLQLLLSAFCKLEKQCLLGCCMLIRHFFLNWPGWAICHKVCATRHNLRLVHRCGPGTAIHRGKGFAMFARSNACTA